jgi:hypothetical protein
MSKLEENYASEEGLISETDPEVESVSDPPLSSFERDCIDPSYLQQEEHGKPKNSILYVTGLPEKYEEQEIQEMFRKYGHVMVYTFSKFRWNIFSY